MRLELSYDRNTDIMKKIIKSHIKTGNIVVTDGWSAYSWLGHPFSGYIHSMHSHGAGTSDMDLIVLAILKVFGIF